MDDRFNGFRSLVGDAAYAKVAGASVCIIGVGGVGSWAAEAIARCGVSRISIVDLDEVCITNVNRQLHALQSTIGHPKVSVLAARMREINPACEAQAIERYFTEQTSEEILRERYDVVIDCIDRLSNKVLLIAECVKRGTPIITAGSAGDRRDPTAIQVTDLARTAYDPLLSFVRKRLRQEYGFSRSKRAQFGVPCVYIPQQRGEQDAACETAAIESCEASAVSKNTAHKRTSCNDGLGTAGYVTAAMGFACASQAIELLIAARPAE